MRQWKRIAMMVLVVTALQPMANSGQAGLLETETVGERFRNALKAIEAACQSRRLEPNEVCGAVTRLQPADPLATEEGRFAHSIKIPNPLPPDSGYKPGMTSQEYFDHLCKTEAGEFIYRTVDNVEGIYMMRPRTQASDDMQEHLYAMEDPYGYTDAEAQDAEFFLVAPLRYKFLELPRLPGKRSSWGRQFLDPSYFMSAGEQSKYERYSGSDGRDPKTMTKGYDSALRSRYGYTWRGVTRPNDRELGIAGGELIVLDLRTKEVLGVRRGYVKTGNVRNNLTGVRWLTGQACPRYELRGGRSRDFDFVYWFIGKVLKPVHYEQSFRELADGK